VVAQPGVGFEISCNFELRFSNLKHNTVCAAEKAFRQTQVGDGFEQICFTLAVFTKNRIDPPSEESIGVSVIAEFLDVEFADLHIL
jgi:hypothetical protein